MRKVVKTSSGTFLPPVYPDSLIVDEVPTQGSFNAVSSDGVAKAVIQAGAELPTRGTTDTGKVLTVANSDGDLAWSAPETVTVDQVYDSTSANAQSGVAVASAVSGKQDTISDLSTIRSGAALGATAVQPSSLATVATTGSYNDLTNKPSIPAAVTVDQVYDSTSTNAQSGVAVSGALATVNQVPASTSADATKVLTVNAQGAAEWAAAQGGGSSYTAGAGIDISAQDEISAKIDNSTLTTDEITTSTATFSTQLSTGYDASLYDTRIYTSMLNRDTKVYTFQIPSGGLQLGSGITSGNIYPVLRASNSTDHGVLRINKKLDATFDSNTSRYTITGGQTFNVCFDSSSPYYPVGVSVEYGLSRYYYLTFAPFTDAQIADQLIPEQFAGADSSSATIAFDYKASGTILSVNTDVVQPKLTAGAGIVLTESNEISVFEGEEVPITSTTSSAYSLGGKLNYNHLRICFHEYTGYSNNGHLVKDVYSDRPFNMVNQIDLSDFYYGHLGTTVFTVTNGGANPDTINIIASYFNSVSGGDVSALPDSSWVIDRIIGFNDSPFVSQS